SGGAGAGATADSPDGSGRECSGSVTGLGCTKTGGVDVSAVVTERSAVVEGWIAVKRPEGAPTTGSDFAGTAILAAAALTSQSFGCSRSSIRGQASDQHNDNRCYYQAAGNHDCVVRPENLGQQRQVR